MRKPEFKFVIGTIDGPIHAIVPAVSALAFVALLA